MKIAIVGPIATQDIVHLLQDEPDSLPSGYPGAPLLATLITELLKRGHEVVAITMSGGLPLEYSQPIMGSGQHFSILYVPMRLRAWRPNAWYPGRILDLYRMERMALRRALKMARPDVVHAHWSYEFAWAAQQTGLPLVITCHDSPFLVARLYAKSSPTRSLYRWLRAGMAWYVLRNAKRVTAVSPYMKDQIQPLCQCSVSVVPNPIGEQVWQLAQHRRGEGLRLAMICNGWSQRKNPETCLRAFSLIAERFPNSELHAFGHDFGPGERAQKWWVEKSLTGNVIFHGSRSHVEVLRALSGCDVLLHSALEESFGMVLAEAMALGVLVIAGRSSGAVPWVVGEAGCLVDITRPEEMADVAISLISDPGQYDCLAQQARASIYERFRVELVVAAYEHEYMAALNDGRDNPPEPDFN